MSESFILARSQGNKWMYLFIHLFIFIYLFIYFIYLYLLFHWLPETDHNLQNAWHYQSAKAEI